MTDQLMQPIDGDSEDHTRSPDFSLPVNPNRLILNQRNDEYSAEFNSNDAVDNLYTILQRPIKNKICTTQVNSLNNSEMEYGIDDASSDSFSDGSSDNCLKPSRSHDGKKKRPVMVRVQNSDEKRPRFKKNNIWCKTLQEETLTETMRDIEVTSGRKLYRSAESYEVPQCHITNGRKRTYSDEDVERAGVPSAKRGRWFTNDAPYMRHRHSYRSRFNQRNGERSRASGDSDHFYRTRVIPDLNDVTGQDAADIAREMAKNLYEKKADLMITILDTLGLEIPLDIYKQTQRIEAGGGMMVMDGSRRRTSGGIFFYLLKHDDRICEEDFAKIFGEDNQNNYHQRRQEFDTARDRKVEELKKCLNENDGELSSLSSRKDLFLLGSDLTLKHQSGNLSNPPPSPVGIEQSPEYKPHTINHVVPEVSSDKTLVSAAGSATNSRSTSPKYVSSYEDDFLDLNGGDMDFF